MSSRSRADLSHTNDDGFTLVEVMVGMTILSIFLAIFGGAMVSMFHSVDHTRQGAYAQSEINKAYITLDRELRFANGISAPGLDPQSTHYPEVEFSDITSGSQWCYQLRLTASGSLQQRSWIQPDDTSAAITPGPTVILATGLTTDTLTAPASANPVTAGPFATLPTATDAGNEQLEISLTAQDPSQAIGANKRLQHMDATFTALNTDPSTTTASVCSNGRSTPWSDS